MSEKSFNPTLYNFLDPKLSPIVSCPSPATDNYEVNNLISDNFSKKSLGFLAYSAIKPPVEIEFKFICPINIYHIMVNTTVGSQKSTGIELFAKNDSQEYTYISKSIHDKSGVFFCNSKIYSKDKFPTNYNNETFNLVYFNRSSYKVFLEATSIQLKIFQTHKSVPCLGAVEVWGIPAKCCSIITKNTINHIMTKKVQLASKIDKDQEKFCIPDDFKDDLTYELMSVPFTLPSGKTIDQTTLDKHVEIERQFGRKPCDPFTGLKFSQTLKPVLNMALKSRIDMFMLENSSRPELSNYKRTLGRAYLCNKVKEKNKKMKVTTHCDLDEAIARVKESPNFINITNSNLHFKHNSCAKCHKVENFLYKISCQHYHCRQCLSIIITDCKCGLCAKTFSTKDIEKINL